MSRRLPMEIAMARDYARNSSSFSEFKMKFDLAGLELYNIDMLRTVRNSMKSALRRELDKHIEENIDLPSLSECALDAIAKRRNWQTTGALESFLAKIWIKKHEREYR